MDRKDMKRLVLPMSFKAGDQGMFTGYGNVSGIVDSGFDRVLNGAFTDDLRARGPVRPLLWSHMEMEPLGTVEVAEDAYGLRVTKGQLVLGVQRAREIFELLKATPAAIGGMSIGYTVSKDRITSEGVRELVQLKLFEISLCCFPMNALSVVDSSSVTVDTDAQKLIHITRTIAADAKAYRQRNMDSFQKALDNFIQETQS